MSSAPAYIAPYPAGDPRASMTDDERQAALKKVTLDDAKKFYADFYGASNAEFVVIGDFDPAEVQKLVAGLFGDWKSPRPYKVITRDWQKLTPVERSTETPDKTDANFTMISTLAMTQDDPGLSAAWYIADLMLGGDEKSRLWTRIREKEGLSYSVKSSLQRRRSRRSSPPSPARPSARRRIWTRSRPRSKRRSPAPSATASPPPNLKPPRKKCWISSDPAAPATVR